LRKCGLNRSVIQRVKAKERTTLIEKYANSIAGTVKRRFIIH